LFLDPSVPMIKARIAWRLIQKRLGFRMLMDAIPLDASLVRGSHGRCPEDPQEWPVLLTSRKDLATRNVLEASDVFELLQRHFYS